MAAKCANQPKCLVASPGALLPTDVQAADHASDAPERYTSFGDPVIAGPTQPLSSTSL
jgi:hypothetical protein